MAPFPGFVGPTYRSKSRHIADDRCINFYVDPVESGNPRSPLALQPMPGLETFATPTNNPFRGCLSKDGRAFAVIGYIFYEVASDGTLTNRGVVEVNDNPATLSSSGDAGNEIFITSGRNGYIFNLLTNVFTGPISGLDVDMGAYLDGRFLALDAELSVLRISDLLDGTSWNPLRYRQRALAPDKWKAMVVANDVIWLMGSETYEVWWNSGASPFPFEPLQGNLFPVGIAAPFSLKSIAGSVFWVTSSEDGHGQVAQATQYSPSIASSISIDENIQSWSGMATAESMTFQFKGHNFYILTSRDDDHTWGYDLTTRMWIEPLTWQSNRLEAAHFTAWRPLYHMMAFGKHLVGDRATGVIYEMSDEHYYDAGGAPIRRVRRAPHLYSQNKTRYRSLTIDVEPGMGSIADRNEEALMSLRYSDNGGMTFGNEHVSSLGRRGQYNQRVKFYNLGQSNRRVFEIITTEPIRITGAELGIG